MMQVGIFNGDRIVVDARWNATTSPHLIEGAEAAAPVEQAVMRVQAEDFGQDV